MTRERRVRLAGVALKPPAPQLRLALMMSLPACYLFIADPSLGGNDLKGCRLWPHLYAYRVCRIWFISSRLSHIGRGTSRLRSHSEASVSRSSVCSHSPISQSAIAATATARRALRNRLSSSMALLSRKNNPAGQEGQSLAGRVNRPTARTHSERSPNARIASKPASMR